MKKVFVMVMTVAVLVGMTGCNVKKNIHVRVNDKEIVDIHDVDYDELKKNDGLMFTARSSNSGEVSNLDDYWVSDSYKVYYDGKIEKTTIYNLSGTETTTDTISDEDYETLYDMVYSAYKTDEFEDYNEDACDGTSWSFDFYDEQGEKHSLYRGYAYDNDSMLKFQEIVEKYAKES